ncbi:MAG TPA: hypothetical protein PLC39_03855 [Methanomassiliicoccales archaeon]|nr:hypothetical protein [Methanomassiliicoccales archaeon]HNX47595.1 hypothetical protein [Methanomassiliicoccales archaeon]HPR98415.1 hypothetical protein [Methanomassiliicoccales archaeon]
MAEAKKQDLPFAADALHTTALATPFIVAFNEGEAGYYGLSHEIQRIGRSCLTPGARVVDLRCDLNLVMPIIEENEDLCRFTLLSPDERSGFRCFDKLRTRVRLGFVDAAQLDLNEGFPEVSARMVLAIGALGGLSERRRTEVADSMHRRMERNGVGVIMEVVETDVAPGLRRKRPLWSAAEWESLFKNAGFRSVQRLWTDGERMAWTVKK